MRRTALRLLMIVSLLVVLSDVGPVWGALIRVPDDYPTIQIAIDFAQEGDEIVVDPGRYHEVIDLGGKSIHLRSLAGPQVTVIDGTGIAGSVVTCKSGESNATTLEGFALLGGTGTPAGPKARRGGGMYLSNSNPTVIGCWFIFNQVTQFGGGAYCESSSATFRDCSFSGNTALAGGGLYAVNAPLTLTRCTFDENSAEWGGGIANSQSDLTIDECGFSGNTAGMRSHGGAISNSICHPVISHCVFTNNSAGTGGAISNNDATPMITDCVFDSNRAENGGGLSIQYCRSSDVERCRFVGNTAGGEMGGGGLLAISSDVLLEDSEFENNSAEIGHGGGVFAGGSLLRVGHGRFVNNRSVLGCGGGLHSQGHGRLFVVSSTFEGNEADLGGALHDSGDRGTITQCLMFANSARRYGGGLFSNSDRIEIANCTIVMNTALVGGGVFTNADRTVVSNSVLWYNSAERGREFRLATGIANFYYSNIRGGIPAQNHGGGGIITEDFGNISSDPMFANAIIHDFRVQCGSPCIDAGLNEIMDPELVDDLAGHARFVDDPFITDTGHGRGAVVDMGVYEWQAELSPEIFLSPEPLRGGEVAKVRALNLRWNTPAYLLYSLEGPGQTFLPGLNVMLDIKDPFQLGPARFSSADGRSEWRFEIPNRASGRYVWFQLVQSNLKTNVVSSEIE